MLRNTFFVFLAPLVLAFSLPLLCCRPDAGPYQQWCEQSFRPDSGFVNSSQATELQRLICRYDSAVFSDEYRPVLLGMLDEQPVSTQDSLGKYYGFRLPNGDERYVLYLPVNILFGDAILLLEFKSHQGVWTFEGHEWFFHGNHACCLENDWSEFSRLGPYLYVKTCGTGSGFCSGAANFVFFPLTPNDDNDYQAPAIHLMWWQSFLLSESLTGSLHTAGDTIVAEYTYDVDTLTEDPAGEMIPHPVYNTRFTALFQIDTAARKIRLLDREAVLREKRLDYLFEEY